MKKNLLITAIVLALSGGAFAQTVLPLLPTAHGMTGNQPAYSAQQQQELNLAIGWNWWSSYVDVSNNGLEKLQNALGSSANYIKSQSQITANANSFWSGTLTEISNEQMYMIQTASALQNVQISSNRISTEDIEMSTANGWTWIGFPCSNSTSVSTALADYDAVEGNIIKGQGSSATYFGGEWSGTLTQLVPGQGYMIYGSAQTFNYQTESRGSQVEESPSTIWNSSIHDFASNMNIIATMNLMGEEIVSGDYEVAAFNNSNCRGSVVPLHIGSAEHLIGLMTINGDDGDLLHFRLLDKATGDIYVADNSYTYRTDAIEGSVRNPYVLYFNRFLDEDEYLTSNFKMFPNPVSSGHKVKASIPAMDSRNMNLQIINSLGVVVKNEMISQNEIDFTADLVPGIYTVKIIANEKQLFVEKLLVK